MEQSIPVYKHVKKKHIFIPVPCNFLGDFLDNYIFKNSPMKMEIVYKNNKCQSFDYDGQHFNQFFFNNKGVVYFNNFLTCRQLLNYIKLKTIKMIIIQDLHLIVHVGFVYDTYKYKMIGQLNKYFTNKIS